MAGGRALRISDLQFLDRANSAVHIMGILGHSLRVGGPLGDNLGVSTTSGSMVSALLQPSELITTYSRHEAAVAAQ
jgi:hypothetical protein